MQYTVQDKKKKKRDNHLVIWDHFKNEKKKKKMVSKITVNFLFLFIIWNVKFIQTDKGYSGYDACDSLRIRMKPSIHRTIVNEFQKQFINQSIYSSIPLAKTAIKDINHSPQKQKHFTKLKKHKESQVHSLILCNQ